MVAIDWQSMFIPQGSLLEPLIRGSIMYLGMFILLRIFRRQSGSVSIADLLLIVIIADAAQNGMAGDSKSITEAMLLIGTIIFWDYLLDYLGFKSKIISKILDPEPLKLVENGRILRANMAKEMITEDEIMSHLRKNGIEDLSDVEKCFLESDGEFSIIRKDGKVNQGKKVKKSGVN